jgi:hypothetical protein
MPMKQGDKVICIDNKNLDVHPSNFDKPLLEGNIYHIREIVPGYEFKGQPDGVMLEEINGSVGELLCYDGIHRILETHFRQNRFLVIEELDISDLESIRKELITTLNL